MADTNEDLTSELLGIQLSDSEVEDAAAPAEPMDKASRTAQSEEAFQTVKRSYRVKVENGEIWRTIKLPLDPVATVTKQEAQALLHAVEELYFFRRYGEGSSFVRRVLDPDDGGDGAPPALDEDTRKMLRYYEKKCVQRQKEAADGVIST